MLNTKHLMYMRKTKLILPVLAALAAGACTREPVVEPVPQTGITQRPTQEDAGYVNGWIRIKLAEDMHALNTGEFTRGGFDSGDEYLDEVAERLGATEIRRVFAEGGKFAERRRKFGLHLWYDIRIDDAVSVTRAGQDIADVPGISHVQPVYKIKWADDPTVMPAEYVYAPMRTSFAAGAAPVNDPDIDKQWHYHNDGSVRGSVKGADINLFEAWEKFNAGDPDVIVAVLDQGVEYTHPDLQANMWINEAELNGQPGVDDDNNGYIDDIYGLNSDDKSGDIVFGDHGTHIAGTIAAVNNNGVGVAGIAGGTGNGDGCRVMTVLITPGSEWTNYADAFAYAADNGAVITSNSWCLGMERDGMPQDLSEAIDYFIANAGLDENGVQTGPMKGGICMFAGGNYNNSGPQYVGNLQYPAADPRVIGVTSMGPSYKKAGYSQYGPQADIMAPGGDSENYGNAGGVYSTMTGGGYGYLSGTSMATPHVSGVAALMIAQYGGDGFTVDELKKILLSSYRNVGEYQEASYKNGLGAGLLDASLMDNYFKNPGTAPDALTDPKVEGIADGLVFSCKVPADANGDPATWIYISYAPEGSTDAADRIERRMSFNMGVGSAFSYTATLQGDTAYDVEMTAEDRYGNRSKTYSATTKTLPHINRPPYIVTKFLDFSIQQVSEERTRRFDLSQYVGDPDVGEFGDKLSYKLESNSDDSVVAVTIDGAEATFEPLNIGASAVKIRVSDMAGEYVDLDVNVSVLHKPLPNITIDKAGMENTVSVPLAEYFYDPGIEEYSYEAVSSDRSKVAVNFSDNVMNIVPLDEGSVVIELSCQPGAGNVIRSQFNVEVLAGADSGGGTVPGDTDMALYPNPVVDDLNVLLTGKSGNISVEVYDSAARRVLVGEATLDADGNGVMKVSSLGAGLYSVVVKHGGDRYNGTFVKR